MNLRMLITNLRLSHKVLFILAIIFWIALFIVLIKYALKWDNERYLRAQAKSPSGIVEDRSPEQYHP